MHCQTCGAAHRGRGRLCDECQKTFSGLSGPKKTPVDDFDGNQDFNAPAHHTPPPDEGGWSGPQLVRTDAVPIALGGRFLKRGWLAAVGAAGLVATICDTVFRWGVWWFWLVVPSGFAFFIGYRLIQRRFIRVAGLINFEADKSGRVYLTTLSGDCPACDGEVKLKDVGPKRYVKTVMQCTKDATHRWEFDPRRLDEL